MEANITKNDSAAKNAKSKAGNQEQIVQGFQEMRQQQRAIAGKLSELDMERKEHDLVIETLKDVDSSRKCFRMVGGVLVERTVGEVLPALQSNSEQINKLIEQLTKQLETKGRDLNEYREKFNIRVRGDESNDEQKKESKSSTQSVLVASEKS